MTTQTKLPFWIAHRGDMTRYPENTLLALNFALEQGANAIEFDLQMNLDNDFVVIHDSNFLRTSGVNASVLKTPTKNHKSISVHQPKRYQQRFFPQTIPLLENVLALLSQYPDTKAFIEIKTESLEHWGIEKTMNLLLKKLQKHANQCIVISFNLKAIAYAKKHSNFPVGWVLKKYDSKHHQQALRLNPHFLVCNQRKIPTIEPLWKGSWQWMLYDIVDINKALKLSKRGIHYIETGDIGEMLLQSKRLSRSIQ